MLKLSAKKDELDYFGIHQAILYSSFGQSLNCCFFKKCKNMIDLSSQKGKMNKK